MPEIFDPLIGFVYNMWFIFRWETFALGVTAGVWLSVALVYGMNRILRKRMFS